MLRNRLLPLQLSRSSVHLQLQLPKPQISASRRARSNSAGRTNTARQSKIFGKLFGNRVAGAKSRWYPSHDGSSNYQPPSVVFQASRFGKSNSPGSKQNTRRMCVLNKLFMTSITDLLATGESAKSMQGCKLQVSRVKISADFSCINVYWLGSGELHNDVSLDVELQRCSGQLHHELSQLRLMGEMPCIRFLRDKTGSNSNIIDNILRTLNLSKPEEPPEENEEQLQETESTIDVAQTVRHEFYGNAAVLTTAGMPEMRHDLFGLDHRQVIDMLLIKMHKSMSAWEQHQKLQEQHSLMQRKLSVDDNYTNNNGEKT